MPGLATRIRDLHGGQVVLSLVALTLVTIGLQTFRASIADRPRQRIAEYFAPIQARTEAQLAVIRGGGSIAEANAAAARLPVESGAFPGWNRTDGEVLEIAALDGGQVVVAVLAFAFLWIWFGGRRAPRRLNTP